MQKEDHSGASGAWIHQGEPFPFWAQAGRGWVRNEAAGRSKRWGRATETTGRVVRGKSLPWAIRKPNRIPCSAQHRERTSGTTVSVGLGPFGGPDGTPESP